MPLKDRFYAPLLLLLVTGACASLNAALVSGPMLTHLDMREATVWVQTERPSTVRVTYSEDGGDNTQHWTLPVETSPASGNTAAITLSSVEPGTHYSYGIEVNGSLVGTPGRFATPAFYHERTPPPDLRIAVGGAHYVTEEGFEPPYRILGGGYDIFSTILDTDPDLMLWVGNTAHLRESDWRTQSGYFKRFTTARAIPQLQPLLAATPHYAVWAESDYSFGNAGRHYTYRHFAETSFRAFWPRPGNPEALEGIATRFRRADVDFFLLDVRSYRNDTPDSSGVPQILGNAQIEWLRQELIRSDATFKIIVAGAPLLNPADSRTNLSYADGEQTRFLQMLRDARIPGLVFISGGKYYGELTRLVHAASYNLYDLTVGPLTANPKADEDELNFFRTPGTSTFERHFALVEVAGPEEDRQLTFRVMSMDGQELWNRSISASQLQPPN